jgi:ribosomal protein S18 acetylase RimI-like enzyme
VTLEIVSADASRLGALAHVLARAFVDDPMIAWPLTEGGDLLARAEAMFTLMYEPLVDTGAVWEVPEARGFAVWIPPGATEEMFDSDAHIRSLLAPYTDDGAARYATLWDWIEQQVPSEPVWYLDAIGVDPGHQRQGVGTSLIRAGLDRAAADRVPAFLETARPELLDYYRSLGFDVVAEGEPEPNGPHIWFMRTEPGTG